MTSFLRIAAVVSAALMFGACSLPVPDSGPPAQRYLLSADFGEPGETRADAPVLAVAPPRASAGFDTAQMLYLESPAALDAFANNRWAAPPAEMLEPLLLDALEAAGGFRAVVDGGSGFGAGLRLDTEILRLQQEFFDRPSVVRLAVRTTLVDARSGEVLLARTFETVETAPGNDPESGVAAANKAVSRLLRNIAAAVVAAGG